MSIHTKKLRELGGGKKKKGQSRRLPSVQANSIVYSTIGKAAVGISARDHNGLKQYRDSSTRNYSFRQWTTGQELVSEIVICAHTNLGICLLVCLLLYID